MLEPVFWFEKSVFECLISKECFSEIIIVFRCPADILAMCLLISAVIMSTSALWCVLDRADSEAIIVRALRDYESENALNM